MAAEWIFGRSADIAHVRNALSSRRACVVSGPAGIGKSAITRAIRTSLVADGAEVIAISGSEATVDIPLAPLVRLQPQGGSVDGAAIIAELYRRSRLAEVVLIADDAHLLDPATAAVVRQLAATDAVSVLCAVRSGERAPRAIATLVGDGVAAPVVLTEIDRKASRSLVSHRLGQTTPRLDRWFWDRTRGHPMWLTELIAAVRARNLLVQRGEVWDLAADTPWSPLLQSLLPARLAGLDEPERSAVELVALVDRVRVDVLCSLVSVETVVGLERRGLLDVIDGDARLVHPLFAELVVEQIEPEQARALRVKLADAFATRGEPDDGLVEALLRLDAGVRLGDSLLERATRMALERGLSAYAERMARIRLDRTGEPSAAAELIEALAMQHQWDDARSEFQASIDGVGSTSLEIEAGLWACWARANFEYRDDPRLAAEAIRQARRRVGDEVGLEVAELRASLFCGNLDQSVADHDRLLASASIDSELRRQALVGLATSASHAGPVDRALEAVREYDGGAAMDVENVRMRCVELHAATWMNGIASELERADHVVSDAVATGDPDLESVAAVFHGIALNDSYRPEAAIDSLRHALETGQYARTRRAVPLFLAELARALAQVTGFEDEARQIAEQALALPPAARWLSEPIVRVALAELGAADGGDPTLHVELGLDHARRRGARVHEFPLLRFRAYHLDAADSAERLGALAHKFGGALATLIATEAEALADQDPDALLVVSRRADDLGVTGVAIDAAATAAKFAHTTAPKTALCAELRVEQLSVHAPAMRSHARDGIESVLTQREREVVDGVLVGASNREIAAGMFISLRTVESHLRRVFLRLGLANRRELRLLSTPAVDRR